MPTAETLVQSARRLDVSLRPSIAETPVATWSGGGEASPILLKLENLQVTGSFKARGAHAKLMEVSTAGAVVAASTGNHGLAVSHAGAELGIGVTVYVPRASSSAKLASLREMGASVIGVDGDPVQVELAARACAERAHLPYISPYNDLTVVIRPTLSEATAGGISRDRSPSTSVGASWIGGWPYPRR